MSESPALAEARSRLLNGVIYGGYTSNQLTVRDLHELVSAFEAAVRRDEIGRVMDSVTAGANMGRE